MRSLRPLVVLSTALSIALAALTACQRASEQQQEPPAAASEAPAAAAKAPASRSGNGPPLVLAAGVQFVKPESGDVAAVVRAERERAAADGRKLVVYVGAKWCEPCQRFHEAAKRGDLDADFPNLSVLEFDLDEDRERLVAADYTSKLIPLFVAPGADGRASERRFEGGVKGDGAVRNIVPRLRSLVER